MPGIRPMTFPSRAVYGPLRSRYVIQGCEDEDEELTNSDDQWPHDLSRSNNIGQDTERLAELPRDTSSSNISTPTLSELRLLTISETVAKHARRYCVFYLANIFVSVFVILCGVGLSLGLGFYSLMVLKPSPVIDKSIEAFNIPNHISSRRQDALEEAMSEWKSRLLSFRYRKKRDVTEEDQGEIMSAKPIRLAQTNDVINAMQEHAEPIVNIQPGSFLMNQDTNHIQVTSNGASKHGDHNGNDTLQEMTDTDHKYVNPIIPMHLHDIFPGRNKKQNDRNKAVISLHSLLDSLSNMLHNPTQFSNVPSSPDDSFQIYKHSKGDTEGNIVTVSKQAFRDRLTRILDQEWQDAAAEEQEMHLRNKWDSELDPHHAAPHTSHLQLRGGNSTRLKRDTEEEPRRIYGRTQVIRRWKMMLVYLAIGDDDLNIFTQERLEAIHGVEETVKQHPDYTEFCHIDYDKWEEDPNLDMYNGCAPLNSLLTYFYPSNSPDGTIHYDGLGETIQDINRTLAFAMTKESFFWFVDDHISATNRKSRLLRTEAHFGVPLPGYLYYSDRKDEQLRKYVDFIITYIDVLSIMSTPKVRVLYGGNELFDHEVDVTFWTDLRRSFLTLGFIVLFMFILTSFSVWLTFWGMTSIILSFPLAFFFYRYVFGVVTLGILNGVAAFVIIGIGVDDVFVFVNTFRHSHYIKDRGERMLYTMQTAGKATFFTSFTTSAAFAANVASSIPAIHDFGLFMSLIVGCCWVMVIWLMPPVINIWAIVFAKCEHHCYHSCPKNVECQGRRAMDLPSEIGHYLDTDKSELEGEVDLQEVLPPETISQDTEDVRMVTDLHDHDGGWPIYLGMLSQMLTDDDDPLIQLETELDESINTDEVIIKEPPKEGCHFTNQLQALMYYLVAKPIVKMRWTVCGVYIGFLLVSIGLMVQLQPATKPPQLFDDDTNLQMLMDLATNFSDSDITCDECSGFYMEGPVSPHIEPSSNSSSSSPATISPISGGGFLPLPPLGGGGGNNGDGGGNNGNNDNTGNRPTTTQITSTTASTTVNQDRTTPTHHSTQGSDSSLQRTSTLPSTVHTPSTEEHSMQHDPCANGACEDQQTRPNLEVSAVVYIVFGIKDIDRTNVSYQHVLTERGTVEYDEYFESNFSMEISNLNIPALRDLCRLCHIIANNTELVKPNSTQCVPQYGLPSQFLVYMNKIPECQHLPENSYSSGQNGPSRAVAGMTINGVQWLAFAVESTTYKGQSYFTAYNEYQKWESFIDYIKSDMLAHDSVLQTIYQTSEFWENVMMEVVAVSSAIYGLLLSMVICITAVAVFTGHIVLLTIVFATIFGTICMVVGVFYLVGWEMGAVEAVSLSILVGSSVDYCVHLVEGYLIAGNKPPPSVAGDNGKVRRWRTLVAVSHIGVSITSSAITTIVAAIPLTQTTIQPFSKFGQIVTINTSVSITYTLTACVAMLALFSPAMYVNTWRSVSIATITTTLFIAVLILILYIMSQCGVNIPAPSGENLF